MARRNLLAFLLLALTIEGNGLEDGLARTPPRGWRSWNDLRLSVTQNKMEAVIDAMVDTRHGGISLASLGYSDVGLDDGWEACQASGGYHSPTTGAPAVNASIFPSLGAMVARAHARNLTAGWYLNCCACRSSLLSDCADIQQCYKGDIAAFRSYGFDGVKLDDCGAQADISMWSTLLSLSGRPVLIENCKNGVWFPFKIPFPWLSPPASTWCPFHMYRTSTDVSVNYGAIMGKNLQSMLPFADSNLSFPGCWAYADMLEVGVPAHDASGGDADLSFAEARAHFGAYCITSSPLILGLDVTNASALDAVWPILSNAEALAVNSAYAGSSGTRIDRAAANVTWAPCGEWPSCAAGAWEVWSKPLGAGSAAVLILNHEPALTRPPMPLSLASVPGLECGASCLVRDVWAHADLPPATAGTWLAPAIASHDSVFIIFSPPG